MIETMVEPAKNTSGTKTVQPAFSRLTLLYSSDPEKKKMGGAVGYMQFLFRQALKHDIPLRFIGVNLTGQHVREGYEFIPVQNGNDSWQQFLLRLFFKAPFLKFKQNEIVHVFRIAYCFPLLLFHPRIRVVCVSAEPLAAAAHRYPVWLYKIVEKLFTLVERFVLSRIRVLCTSDEVLGKYFQPKYRRHLTRLPVFLSTASGIDTELFQLLDRATLRQQNRIQPSEKILLFVGRLAPVKRVNFLLEIFKKFHETCSFSRFLIVGNGESLPELQRTVENLPVTGVEFRGERSQTELVQIYNIADVLLLASETEGNPTVVREALACGLPVISTPVGDVPRLLSAPEMGKIVSPNSRDEYLAAVKEILEYDRAQIRRVCRQAAENFSEEKIFHEILQMYQNIVDRTPNSERAEKKSIHGKVNRE